LSHVMLTLPKITIEQSNMRKKRRGTIECNKNMVTCDVSTAQCDDEIMKCKKNK